MRLLETAVAGVFAIGLEPIRDERGFFARVWCEEEFTAAGLDFRVAQANLSRNTARGTLRGMHFQEAPHAEAKIVRVVRGRAWDVALDLRPASPTFRRWTAVELSAAEGNAVLVPEGCAHGFLTLEDETDVLYLMGQPQTHGHGRGVRWDDPAFGIGWPEPPRVLSDRDRLWPLQARDHAPA